MFFTLLIYKSNFVSIGYYLLYDLTGVYGSVRVGFVPNPESTCSYLVGGWMTRHWLLTTSDRAPMDNGRVGQSWSKFQPLDLCQVFTENRQIFTKSRRIFSESVDFSLDLCDNHGIEARKTTSSPNLNKNFHLIAESSPYLHRIFTRSVNFSSNLCDNHGIEAKNTTSSPDLSENFHLIAGSNQKLPNLCWIWVDLGRFSFLSRVSSVRSGSSGFGEENPPSDPPKLVFRGKDLPPTVIGVGLAGFWVGPVGLGRWISFWFLVDSPIWSISLYFMFNFKLQKLAI